MQTFRSDAMLITSLKMSFFNKGQRKRQVLKHFFTLISFRRIIQRKVYDFLVPNMM
jgi:hypothetical protein